jgi:hypothetical protein
MSHETRSASRASAGRWRAVHNWGNEDLVGRQNTIRANICFIRTRHDLALEIVALKHQLIVLKRRTKRKRLRLVRPVVLGHTAPSVFRLR